MEESSSNKKDFINVKNILRVLSLLCIIFVFCPSFLVSCSGQQKKVTVFTAVGGVSMYGETVVEPHPFMLICLGIPVIILAVLFIKVLAAKKLACITAAGAAADIIIWLVFRSSVKEIAEENLCEFKSTACFTLNIIALCLIICLSLAVIIGWLQMEGSLLPWPASGSAPGAAPGGKPVGFCTKCGSPLYYGSKFCVSCGTPVPAAAPAPETAPASEASESAQVPDKAAGSITDSTETVTDSSDAQQEGEAEVSESPAVPDAQPLFCLKCGAKLERNAVFCVSCGQRIRE